MAMQQITPAQIAEALEQNAQAQAKARVAALDICLTFRGAMAHDPETAMKHLGEIVTALGMTNKAYKNLKTAERELTALGGV